MSRSGDARKQDCELKALSRWLPSLRHDYPQLHLCLSGDGLNACGRTLQLAKEHHCHYVLTFKAGRLPALWREFQTLLKLARAIAKECRTKAAHSRPALHAARSAVRTLLDSVSILWPFPRTPQKYRKPIPHSCGSG